MTLLNYYPYLKMINNWILDDLSIKKLDGMCNSNYIINNSKLNETLLLKVYNSNIRFDINLREKLYKNGFCAKILLHFDTGYIQEWIPGREFTHSDITSDFLIKIANKLREFHDIIDMNHNDLNFKNIIITNDNEIEFIDYEYSDTKDIEYDIANFFCEWIYKYNKEDWYLYNLDLFPSKSQLELFCQHYLDTKDNKIIDDFITTILNKIDKTHHYWIKWANNYNFDDYKIYSLLRNKLVGFDFSKLLENKIIYCDGTFDLLHGGHLNFFNKIRNLGCKQLIVGVISDLNVKSYKRMPIMSLDWRVKMLENIKGVDLVIRDCPFNNLTQTFLDDYGIDLVIYGGDPKLQDAASSWNDHYKVAIDQDKFKILEYTKGISTSDIIKQCKNL